MSSWVYNWFSWEEFGIFVYYHNAHASLDIDQNENPQNTLQTTGSLLNRIWLTVEQTIYTVNYVTNVKCALKNLKLLKTELRNRSLTLCLMTNSHLSWSKDRMKPFGWQNSFREQFSAKLGGHNVGRRYHKWTQTHEIILDVMSRTLADYFPDRWSTHSFTAGTRFWIQFQLSEG